MKELEKIVLPVGTDISTFYDEDNGEFGQEPQSEQEVDVTYE